MTKETIRERVLAHLSACKSIKISDEETSIFNETMGFEARDLAYLCLRMKEECGCNLNLVIKGIKVCSVHEIVDAFWSALYG